VSRPSFCAASAGPVADSAFARASITAVSVSRSKSIEPRTALTRLGIRSWRRFSCTSIWRQPFAV
jgi:hypothetical protein